ncbi:hypothetical protein ACEV9E_25710, partial [Vibrio parahaemolyticus]
MLYSMLLFISVLVFSKLLFSISAMRFYEGNSGTILLAIPVLIHLISLFLLWPIERNYKNGDISRSLLALSFGLTIFSLGSIYNFATLSGRVLEIAQYTYLLGFSCLGVKRKIMIASFCIYSIPL